MERHPQLLAPPLIESTFLAAVLFEPSIDQSPLEVLPAVRRIGNQELAERFGSRTRPQVASLPCLPQRLRAETELRHAVPDTVAPVIEALNGCPVVPLPELAVGLFTQPPEVVADRRLCDPKLGGNLGEAQSVRSELPDAVASDPVRASVAETGLSVLAVDQYPQMPLRDRLAAGPPALDRETEVQILLPQFNLEA